MTPVFSHGALRLYLLSLLQEHPRHGYELMQALEERFGGTYTPSAGTVYPRLAKLEDDGLVTRSQDGRKVLYTITDAGRAELVARADELDGVEAQISQSVRSLADEVRAGLDQAMQSLRADLKAAEADARAHATPAPTAPRDARAGAVADLDGALSEFRATVRRDIRRRDAHITADAQQAIREVLTDARDRIAALVRDTDGTQGH